MTVEIRTKRVYDEAATDDGCRLLVDRLWPRGISKARAKIDVWAKELTPSHDLRRQFHSNQTGDEEFVAKYRDELSGRRAEIESLVESIDSHVLTLVTSTKDLEHGHVAVLKSFLEDFVLD